MADITTRLLQEDDWQVYRDLRLAALQESPDAFVASYDEESSYDEALWRTRMRRAHRFAAELDGKTVGIAALGTHTGDGEEVGELFGLWAAQEVRGSHIASELVAAAAKQAFDDGRQRLYFWVGSENAAAIGFASNVGFRPTSERRPIRRADGAVVDADEDEVAMVLPLAADPTSVKNPFIP